MDIKTLLSIYNKAWFIEPESAFQFLNVWQNIVNLTSQANTNKPRISYEKFFAKDGIGFAPDSPRSMEDFKGFDGCKIAVIPVSGPLMKDDITGVCGSFESFGMARLGDIVRMADSTPSVEAILFIFDTPGGTVDGTQTLGAIIKSCEKTTIGLVSGMCCSAGYWLGSSCDELYASADTDIIGSIGTMCSVIDDSKQKEKLGIKVNSYFAEASKNKNLAFAQAKEGDGTMLIDEMLNPMNNVFLDSVKANRPGIKSKALDGKTFVGKNAQDAGLIDGIKSFQEITFSLLPASQKSNINFFQKNNMETPKLSYADWAAHYPEHVAKLKTEVLAAEKDRVATWMEFNHVDPKGVDAGIESGKEMTRSEQTAFLRKEAGAGNVARLKGGNAPDVKTDDSGNPGQEDEGAAALARIAKKNGITEFLSLSK